MGTDGAAPYTPLDELRKCHPSEAYELERVSRDLDSAGAANFDASQPINGLSPSLEAVAQAHHRLAEEYNRLLARVRTFPGFSEFIEPKKSAVLCNAATSDPVVIVNVHQAHCDALILQPCLSQVSHVPLPGLQFSQDMQLRVARLMRGVEMIPRPCGPYDEEDTGISNILQQAWVHVVEPVLHHLKVGSFFLYRRISNTKSQYSYLRSLQAAAFPTLHGALPGALSFSLFTPPVSMAQRPSQRLLTM